MSKVIESMTKFHLVEHWEDGYEYFVRVWRNELELKNEYDKKGLTNFVNLSYHKYYKSISKLAKAIGEFERVNAVEVVNNHGEGIVYYSSWP